jgi:ABC-2 type transport system ATP-binding protein
MEVKKRIGYLPETPPLYPEMDVTGYLDLRRPPQGHLQRPTSVKRVADEVTGKMRPRRRPPQADRQALQRLSPARRPGAGHHSQPRRADPRRAHQPASTPNKSSKSRELLKHLAGEHTIILSTHILSEVEHSCRARHHHQSGQARGHRFGRSNLTNRLRGSESVAIEIASSNGPTGHPASAEVQQRLEQVSGVSRVVPSKDPKDGRMGFEVESLHGRQIRSDLARSRG